MHYINGREAHEGDPVVVCHQFNGLKIRAGVIHSIQAGSGTCNAQVSVPLPGRTQDYCVTIGKECVHAEDAWRAATLFNTPPA